MKNYTKIQTKFIEEIQSNVTIYKHNKTNARICIMENNDSNKVFSIAFRTPPINSTGLTHILEHSVLCGSKKYPVKDPFVELLKSSLNTFLNAFTFPDKTMYPAASQNDKDFKNLMSVYMDAVFYPQIYNHEEIFMQEGWHYHLTNENDPITINGVVYNEMKGAFSDPEQILFRTLMHSLYPDTAYGYESGGDPKFIPDLSYEEFKDFHNKFYHPSNSYIYIYGDCDMNERLEWLDNEYLSKFEAIDFDTTVKYQNAFDHPVYVTEEYPISKEEDMKDKTFLSYNIALPNTLDVKLMIAMDIIVSALFNNPGAPLKQALIDAGLGKDVSTMLDDGLLQPLLSIMVVNSNPEMEEKFISLVDEKLKEVVQNGLDKNTVLSIINYAEFKARERAFSSRMPQGLLIQMGSLASWLYDEDEPFSKLETLRYYAELRNDLENGYFEEMINKHFVNNKHKSFVKLIPSYDVAQKDEEALANKLLEYKNSLSNDEIKALIKKNIELEEYQKTPSTKEEIDTLPKLSIEDLNPDAPKFNLEVLNNKYDVLFSNYPINDIVYVNYIFDTTGINCDDIKYLSLYTSLIRQMSTKNMTFKDINEYLLNNSGSFKVGFMAYNKANNDCKSMLKISFSALEENVDKVSDLCVDLLDNTLFNDEKRLLERLSEINANLQMGVSGRGHAVALTRCSSYTDEYAFINENAAGIEYMDFISTIVNNFENEKDNLINKLTEIKNKFMSKEAFTLGVCGSKDNYNNLISVFDKFYNTLVDKSNYEKMEFKPKQLNEGFKTQYNVNFVSRCGKFTSEYNGAMLVLNNALSLDYLWNKVRVLGGAYGCMLQIKPTGIGFTSYRDPNIKRTSDVYLEVVDYINNLNPTEEELLKFKIGAMGGLDLVMHDSEKANTAQIQYFADSTIDLRNKRRRELIEATVEDLRACSKAFKEALDENNICVIGNATKLDESKDLFKNIRNLNK